MPPFHGDLVNSKKRLHDCCNEGLGLTGATTFGALVAERIERVAESRDCLSPGSWQVLGEPENPHPGFWIGGCTLVCESWVYVPEWERHGCENPEAHGTAVTARE